MTGGAWHRPAGSTSSDGWDVVVTPESAGWAYSGLRVATLPPGGRMDFATGEDEAIVLPLRGSLRVACGDAAFDLSGRSGPFAGPTDFAYVPRAASVSLESAEGCRVAVATARSSADIPFRYGPVDEIRVEQRGAGSCSREVRNVARPDAFGADRLIAVEVITPSGNWSSYPPHKHDEERPGETILEEIYYFEIAAGPAGPGLGYQRVYGTPGRPIDLLAEVRQGDVVMIPHGWHGPAMAAPGYDMYYLNVMAGPGRREWRITDDPAHAWVRSTWASQQVDPRLSVVE